MKLHTELTGDARKIVDRLAAAVERGTIDPNAVNVAIGGLNKIIEGGRIPGGRILGALSPLAITVLGISVTDHGKLETRLQRKPDVETPDDRLKAYVSQRIVTARRRRPTHSKSLPGNTTRMFMVHAPTSVTLANDEVANKALRNGDSPTQRLLAYLGLLGAEQAVLEVKKDCQGESAIQKQAQQLRRVVEDWHAQHDKEHPYAPRLQAVEDSDACSEVVVPPEKTNDFGLYVVTRSLMSAARSIGFLRQNPDNTRDFMRVDAQLGVSATTEYAVRPDVWPDIQELEPDERDSFISEAVKEGPSTYGEYVRPVLTMYGVSQRWDANHHPMQRLGAPV